LEGSHDLLEILLADNTLSLIIIPKFLVFFFPSGAKLFVKKGFEPGKPGAVFSSALFGARLHDLMYILPRASNSLVTLESIHMAEVSFLYPFAYPGRP
jgi:hypothetical protein